MVLTKLTRGALHCVLSLLLVCALVPAGAERAYADSYDDAAETSTVRTETAADPEQSPEVVAATQEFLLEAELDGGYDLVEEAGEMVAEEDYSDVDVEDVDGIIVVLESDATSELLSDAASDVVDEVEAGMMLLSEADEVDLLQDAPIAEDIEQAGIEVTDAFALTDGSVMVSADIPEGMSVAEALREAEAVDGVAYAQPNFKYEVMDGMDLQMASVAPLYDSGIQLMAAATNDTYVSQSVETKYYEDRLAGNAYWLYNCNAIEAWNTVKTANKVTVAVFDTGVRLDHVDLVDNTLVSLAYDAYNGKAITVSDFNGGDAHYHGTHVAGIIAARANNGKGTAGVSYNANILPVKVTDDTPSDGTGTTTTHFIRAYEYLFNLIDTGKRQDIRVVNISMGGYDSSYADRNLEAIITKAKNQYRIVTVCAGGNGTGTAPITAPLYPSDFSDAVAVTNLNPNGANYISTDYNKSKDISAPGTNIYSTYSKSKTQYTLLTGSSMACPVVAGACALLFAAKPTATVSQVTQAIYGTAKEVNRYINNFPTSASGSSNGVYNGSHGALDVNAALKSLLGTQPKNYTDVTSKDWFYTQVRSATLAGYIQGIGNGSTFGPNRPIIRADVVTILYRMANMEYTTKTYPAYIEEEVKLSNGQTTTSQIKFSDVSNASMYFFQPVRWAAELGIVKGFGTTNRFEPYQNVTREDFCVMLYRYALQTNTITAPTAAQISATLRKYPDAAQVSTYAQKAVAYLCMKGVFGTASTLRPHDSISRAEVSKMVITLQPRMYAAQLIAGNIKRDLVLAS